LTKIWPLSKTPASPAGIRWPALLIWTIAWALLFLLDPLLDLANLSMLLLLGSVAASLWLTPAYSIAASTVFVVAFNWCFIPPRNSFHVALDKHLLLLVTMVVVNGLIAALMVLQRQAAIKVSNHQQRTTFLTSVSHDFRTPLSTIIGIASSLQEDFRLQGDQRHLHQMSVILEQSNQLNRITNNVLQLVRLDEKALDLKKDWESAEEIIGAAVHLCRQRVPGRTIEAGVPQQLPLLWCHSLLIVQLTAVKDGKHIAFAVTDKGQGVAPELSKTIFEAFERLEPERLQLWQMQDPTARGVGIGLTLCRAITMAHQGSITLTAQPGQGSTFTVRLPIRDNLSTPREV
jgi:K+-sensing histidine kinase KdpD